MSAYKCEGNNIVEMDTFVKREKNKIQGKFVYLKRKDYPFDIVPERKVLHQFTPFWF